MDSPAVYQNGLSRHIPAAIRRQVRRACGFGCVVCGLAFAQYEHFDPPFEEAVEHRVEGIALLCGACHDKKTRGFWSQEKIALARSTPITFHGGRARDVFDLRPPFTLWLGNTRFERVSTIVKTREGERWLSIEEPEDPEGPLRVSAVFYDKDEHESLIITGNEWTPSSNQWDTDTEGNRITVRRGPGDIALELVALPPHGLRVSRLRMRKADVSIVIEPSAKTTIERNGGITMLDGCFASGADCAFLV